jgi:hypothetical protein
MASTASIALYKVVVWALQVVCPSTSVEAMAGRGLTTADLPAGLTCQLMDCRDGAKRSVRTASYARLPNGVVS